MEDDSIPSEDSGGGGSLLPLIALILGVLGLGAGGVGIYFGFQAVQALPSLEETVQEGRGQTGEQLAGLRSTIENLAGEVDHLKNEIVTIKTRARADATRQGEAIEEVYRAINANRGRLNEHSRAIAEIPDLIAKLQPPPPPPAPAPQTGQTPERRETNGEVERDAAGNILHTIQAGDTFGRLAREYEVPLSAILDANPTLNPNALRIGQKVVIPK